MDQNDQTYLKNLQPLLEKYDSYPEIKERAYALILRFARKEEAIPSMLLPFLQEMYSSSIKVLESENREYKKKNTSDDWRFRINCVDLLVSVCNYSLNQALEAIHKRDEENKKFYDKDSLRRKRNSFKRENKGLLVFNIKEFKKAHATRKSQLEKIILNRNSNHSDLAQFFITN